MTSAKMKVLAAVGPGRVAMVDVDVPEPSANRVRVKVEVSAVSAGTEMFVLSNTKEGQTRRLGYMVAGVVDKVGEGVTLLQVGDRVCGMLGPGHAEYAIGEEMRTVAIPDEMSFEDAACSYWIVPAMRGVHRSGLRFYDDAAVIGQGPIGLMATQMLRGMTRHVIAVDLVDARLEVARKFGATWAWNPSEPRPDGMPQPQVVIVASGSEGAFKTACEMVRPRGRVVFLRMPSAAPNLDLEALAYGKDLELIHSGQPCMHPDASYVRAEAEETFERALQVYPDPWYFRRYVAAAVDMVRTGRVDVASVRTTSVSCSEAPRIMEQLFAEAAALLGIAFRW